MTTLIRQFDKRSLRTASTAPVCRSRLDRAASEGDVRSQRTGGDCSALQARMLARRQRLGRDSEFWSAEQATVLRDWARASTPPSDDSNSPSPSGGSPPPRDAKPPQRPAWMQAAAEGAKHVRRRSRWNPGAVLAAARVARIKEHGARSFGDLASAAKFIIREEAEEEDDVEEGGGGGGGRRDRPRAESVSTQALESDSDADSTPRPATAAPPPRNQLLASIRSAAARRMGGGGGGQSRQPVQSAPASQPGGFWLAASAMLDQAAQRRGAGARFNSALSLGAAPSTEARGRSQPVFLAPSSLEGDGGGYFFDASGGADDSVSDDAWVDSDASSDGRTEGASPSNALPANGAKSCGRSRANPAVLSFLGAASDRQASLWEDDPPGDATVELEQGNSELPPHQRSQAEQQH